MVAFGLKYKGPAPKHKGSATGVGFSDNGGFHTMPTNKTFYPVKAPQDKYKGAPIGGIGGPINLPSIKLPSFKKLPIASSPKHKKATRKHKDHARSQRGGSQQNSTGGGSLDSGGSSPMAQSLMDVPTDAPAADSGMASKLMSNKWLWIIGGVALLWYFTKKR